MTQQHPTPQPRSGDTLEREAPPTSGADRARVLAELLPALLEVKTWLRDVSSWQLSEHATTSLQALALLERCGPSRVGDLADAAHLSPSVVSRQAKALHAAGLVDVDTDSSDGRVRRLQLSAEGARVLTNGRQRMSDLLLRLLAEWSTEELAALTAGLRRLVHDLDEAPLFVPEHHPNPRRHV